MRYRDIQSAFAGELCGLLLAGHIAEPIHDPASPASEFGSKPRPSIELFGTSFQIEDPTSTIVWTSSRAFNLDYGVGLLLWTLAGSDDPEWIQFYRAKKARQKKAAFGHRLFNYGGNVDQVKLAIERLGRDGGTRRAFMPIFSVDDGQNSVDEIPCAAGFQLFLRSGALHGVTFMRAQNALLSLPMDLFIFMSLLNVIADQMRVAVGSYAHLCSTFHVFEEDREELRSIKMLGSSVEFASLGSSKGFSGDLSELFEFERIVRSLASNSDVRGVEELAEQFIDQEPFESELAKNLGQLLLSICLKRLGRQEYARELHLADGFTRLILPATSRALTESYRAPS